MIAYVTLFFENQNPRQSGSEITFFWIDYAKKIIQKVMSITFENVF